MMASFMSLFTGRRDAKQTARDAIVSLREQLLMIEKKEEHLQRQIAQDLATAKANAVSNKTGTPVLSHFPPTKYLSTSRSRLLTQTLSSFPLFHRYTLPSVIRNRLS